MRSNTSNNRRGRGRNNNNNRKGNNRSQVFDSNGPEVRIRGTAHQVTEKYQALAKDASSSGDTVLAQSYLQHAEHYQRIINSWDEEENRQKAQQAKENERREKMQAEMDELALPESILTPTAPEDVAQTTA